jgi:phage terminase large subunit-like protein
LFSIWIDDALKGIDKQLVCHLYAAEAGCDLEDRKAWAAANPGLNTIRSLSDLEAQVMEAVRLPSRENSVRNLLFNQRIERNAPFITPTVWKRNSGPFDKDLFFDGRPVYGGLDLSSRNDLTALTLCAVADDGHILLWVVAWTPSDTLAERERQDRIDYSTWVRQGVLRALPGKSISYQSVAMDIGELVEGMNLIALAYDQWRIDILQSEMERLGIAMPLEPFGQGFKSMAPAVSEFESYALEGYFRHNDNPILTNAVANAVIEMNSTGERKVTKVKSNGRIDAAISSLMAVYAMRRGREREIDVSAMIG